MGARPIRRAIEHHLEDPLSEMLLKNSKSEGIFTVDVKEGKITISKKKEKKAKAPATVKSSDSTD